MENVNYNQAMDLRINVSKKQMKANSSNQRNGATSSETSKDSKLSSGKQRKQNINVFKKHKLKYRYLWKRPKQTSDFHKQTSDSGNFGSGSMVGSSSTSNSMGMKSTVDESTSSPGASSSPVSGNSTSPQNFPNLEVEPNQQMCMMLGHAVPLIVMVQGQLQTTVNHNNEMSCTDTMLFKCNMCNMFCNSLTDILSHVHGIHRNVNYCFVCSQFFNSKHEYDRHKDVCSTTRQAFQQIVNSHNQGGGQHNSQSNTQDQALNLTVAGDVAKRAAEMVLNKKNNKNRKKKIKNLYKCTFCKKAFFGKFYLQRHMRSHTGEKLCHCQICGKGFVECRNLRNHMNRFHNTSESISSTGASRQSKSASPNNTSDSSEYRNDKSGTSQTAKKLPGSSKSQSSAIPASTALLDSQIGKQINAIQSCQTWTTESRAYRRSNMGNGAYSQSASAAATQSNVRQQNYPPTFDRSWSMPSNLNTVASALDSQSCSITSSEFSINNSADTVAASLPAPEEPGVSEDMKSASLTYLGCTSSRLELSNSGQQSHEKSLVPISDEQGKKIYRCHVCEKTFTTKFAMQRHLDFHADKRPFQCDQCNYRAKTRPQLKVHVMRHSGQKGFNCATCNYSCVTHSDLNRHCKSRSHLFRVSLLEQKSLQALTANATATATTDEAVNEANNNSTTDPNTGHD